MVESRDLFFSSSIFPCLSSLLGEEKFDATVLDCDAAAEQRKYINPYSSILDAWMFI